MKHQDNKKMHSLYKEWLGSGESRAGFAKGRGIAPNTFNYWIKRFQEAAVVEKVSSFKEVTIKAPATAIHPVATIHFVSGVKIELYHQPEASFLKELVL